MKIEHVAMYVNNLEAVKNFFIKYLIFNTFQIKRFGFNFSCMIILQ